MFVLVSHMFYSSMYTLYIYIYSILWVWVCPLTYIQEVSEDSTVQTRRPRNPGKLFPSPVASGIRNKLPCLDNKHTRRKQNSWNRRSYVHLTVTWLDQIQDGFPDSLLIRMDSPICTRWNHENWTGSNFRPVRPRSLRSLRVGVAPDARGAEGAKPLGRSELVKAWRVRGESLWKLMRAIAFYWCLCSLCIEGSL